MVCCWNQLHCNVRSESVKSGTVTLYEFNSKINLPKLFAGMGVKGYQYVKSPVFGWWAFTPDKKTCVNVFDLFPIEEASKLYRTVVLDKPDYLDFRLRFSDIAESKLTSDITRIAGWNSLWKIAKDQAHTGKIAYNKEYIHLYKLAKDLGYASLIAEGQIGLINDYVLDRFKWLKIPAEAKNKILIPTFAAPGHICSLSYAPISDLTNITVLWKEREHGWHGSLCEHLSDSFRSVATNGGFTWDYKADFWLNNVVTTMSPELKAEQLLKVWCDAKNAQFAESPLLTLKNTHKPEIIKHHIKDLSYAQIKELETVLGSEFLSTWKSLREQQLTIGRLTFVKKHNQYFVIKNGVTSQFTNFTLEVSCIEKDNNEFYRIGHIYCKDAIIPFKIKTDLFTSNKPLLKALTSAMLEAGVGLPLVTTSLQAYLIDVINMFNEDAMVQTKATS